MVNFLFEGWEGFERQGRRIINLLNPHLPSRIYFVAKPLKYASIPADFDASYLHKANSMNKAG